MSHTGLSCSPLLYHVLQNRLRQSIETEHPGRKPGDWVNLEEQLAGEEDDDDDDEEEGSR